MAQINLAHQLGLTEQLAVGHYNLDFGCHVPPIAVEVVFETASHFNGAKGRQGKEKLEYLSRRGWFVLFVIAVGAANKRRIDWPDITHQIVAYCNLARRNHASVAGKHGVAWGNGKTSSRAGYDFGQVPFVPSPSARIDVSLNNSAPG
jgi:very-short-patch-repair endonuclease